MPDETNNNVDNLDARGHARANEGAGDGKGAGAEGAGAGGKGADDKSGAGAGAAGAGAKGADDKNKGGAGEGDKPKEGVVAKDKDGKEIPPTPKLLADDDDELDDKSPYTITGAALKKRLGRFTKKQLREAFGTDDVKSIQGKLKEHGELLAKAEEDRRSKLKEEEKIKEDLAKEKQRADAAEARAKDLDDARDRDQQETRVVNLAREFVKPKYVKHAIRDFAEHLVENLSEKEIEGLTDEKIKAHFEKYVEENPEFSAKEIAAAEKDREKRGASNGAPVRGKGKEKEALPSGSGGDKKTAKPGTQNTLSRAELKSKYGISY